MNKIMEFQKKALKAISGKLINHQLAGGTALSLFYFHHRESYDLDFFTKNFSKKTAEKIVSDISSALQVKIDLVDEISEKDKVRMLIYSLHIDQQQFLKIDFVEDVFRRLKDSLVFDGIPVLSKEDIYLRKIIATCGSVASEDDLGRKLFLGGRQEAKDFFDLYHLSHTFMSLSKFAIEHCNSSEKESIISWASSYKSTNIKFGLNELITDKEINFTQMDRHFRHEINKLIKMDSE